MLQVCSRSMVQGGVEHGWAEHDLKACNPDYFFESKWMIDMLKGVYHPEKLCVIAHDNVVQLVWKGGTENNWVHFAPEEDAMVIQLGVVCTGNVRMKEFLKKVDKVISQWAYAFPIQHNL